MAYPDKLLRGIWNKQFIDYDDSITSDLFYFNLEKPPREDGFREESISWMDDEGAVTTLLNQKNADSTLQFKIGLAVLSRNEIDNLKKKPWIGQKLEYERQITAENIYHGNLLLNGDVPKRKMKLIGAGIALCVESIIRRDIEK